MRTYMLIVLHAVLLDPYWKWETWSLQGHCSKIQSSVLLRALIKGAWSKSCHNHAIMQGLNTHHKILNDTYKLMGGCIQVSCRVMDGWCIIRSLRIHEKLAWQNAIIKRTSSKVIIRVHIAIRYVVASLSCLLMWCLSAVLCSLYTVVFLWTVWPIMCD